MSESDKEAIVVRDRSSRRQFIRRGAAFVAVGGLVSVTQNVYADDCDRNEGSEKNVQAQGSDSDSGTSADPTGCGKRPPPKISKNQPSLDYENTLEVSKIKV